MKKGLRTAAGFLLVALLLVLVSTDGNSPALLNPPSQAEPLPVSGIDMSRSRISKEGMTSVLLCLYEKPSNLGGAGRGLIALYWLSIDSEGVQEAVNIPAGTRALVRADDGKYAYGTPGAAFLAGRSDPKPFERLKEAAQILFYQAEADGVIALEAQDFAGAVDALGGLYTRWDDFSVSVGGVVVSEADRGRPVLLSGEKALRYLSSDNAGTDTGALDRQNHILAVLLERLSEKEDPFGWLEERYPESWHCDVDAAGRERIASALSVGTCRTSVLPGEARIISGQSWLPDKGAIKAYVLKRYYAEPEASRASSAAEGVIPGD